jgi:hypothetical protein
MRRILVLVVLFGVSAGVLADHQHYRFSSSGYYFRPPRTLFYLRPDFLFQPRYGFPGYGYHKYHYYPGYPGSGWAGLLLDPGMWTQGQRGTYSTYLQRPVRAPIVRSNSSDLIFDVTPARAVVYLNGKRIGAARDLASERDRYMVLDGHHELRVEYPGYKPFRADLEIEPNRTVRLEIKLDPLPGR